MRTTPTLIIITLVIVGTVMLACNVLNSIQAQYANGTYYDRCQDVAEGM